MESSQERKQADKPKEEASVSPRGSSNTDRSNGNVSSEKQLPPAEVAERSDDNNSSSTPSSHRIPSAVFARTTTAAAPSELWSCTSNDSLFSIYMGNTSFSGAAAWDHSGCYDSNFSGRVPEVDNDLHNAPNNNNNLGGVTKCEPSDRDAETRRQGMIDDEQDCISASTFPAVRGIPHCPSHRSDESSVKSFAFPILGTLGDVDKSISMTPRPVKNKKPSQWPQLRLETPNAEEQQNYKPRELEPEVDQNKTQTPKTNPPIANRNPKRFSCFPCF